tara:strand:+ start:44286 stop:45401 length:1116 start_codon:yes stop_codon:yes gene_type:complete
LTQILQIVVVGAGVVGCAIAHELARRGARVHVIERREIGQGATRASAGVLAPYLEAHRGGPLVDLCVRSLSLYDEFVARVVEDSGSTIQYVRNGTLEIATNEAYAGRLKDMAQSFAELGIAMEFFDSETLRLVEPQLTNDVKGGLLVASHGYVGANELTNALRRAAVAHGVKFSTSTAATKIIHHRNGIGIRVGTETVVCDRLILAAGSWSGQIELEGVDALPVRPIRGQLLRLDWPTTALNRTIWSEDCYLVPWNDGSVLVGATSEDVGFDERATVAGLQKLVEVAKSIVPGAGEAWLKEVRVGLRPTTPDGLPVIGLSKRLPGLIYASGHYRNGVLLAPLTASIVADLAAGDTSNDVATLTNPSRFGEY